MELLELDVLCHRAIENVLSLSPEQRWWAIFGAGHSILNLVLSTENKADLAPFLLYCLWTLGSPLNNWKCRMYDLFLHYKVSKSALTLFASERIAEIWLSKSSYFKLRCRCNFRTTKIPLVGCFTLEKPVQSMRYNKVHRDPRIT